MPPAPSCVWGRHLRWAVLIAAGIAALAIPASAQNGQGDDKGRNDGDKKDARPSLSLRASPAISFSPSRVYLVAELKGGSDDYEEFYCPAIEWEWGDGTRSQATYDCEPYQAGQSEIKRRYAVEHIFRRAGQYRVQFKLKRKDDVVGVASTTVQVRPGIRDIR